MEDKVYDGGIYWAVSASSESSPHRRPYLALRKRHGDDMQAWEGPWAGRSNMVAANNGVLSGY